MIDEVLEKTKRELWDLREELIAWQCQCTSACDKLQQQKDVNSMMKREMCRLQDEQKVAEKTAEEASKLRKRLKELRKCIIHIKYICIKLICFLALKKCWKEVKMKLRIW